MQKFKGSMLKHDFVSELQKHLQKQLGIDVSLKMAWNIFKLCTLLPYHITAKKGLKVVLAGIGKFQLYKTPKTGSIIPKFYAGETPIRVLTMGLDMLDFVLKPTKYRALRNTNPDGTLPASNPDEKPKKETKKSTAKKVEEPKEEPKKATTKKVEVKKELQAEVDAEVDDFSDFDDFEL